MDCTVYEIALAGFLHDIGKFAERAGFDLSAEFLNDSVKLYQPYNGQQNKYTHPHSVYTAAFISHIEKYLPTQFDRAKWGLEDSLIKLAAGHHNPKTPLQWVISMADRVSGGFDAGKFEDYNQEIGVSDYSGSRLVPLFEGISLYDNWKPDTLGSYHYRYLLKELSPHTMLPTNSKEYQVLDSKEVKAEYTELLSNFVSRFEKLKHRDNLNLWFEHFDSLLMIFTSQIPAATVGSVAPDVSLYDHCRVTAALSTAIYKYHAERHTLDTGNIQAYDDTKLLIVSGDFAGIQEFIFAHGGSTGKASAKLLRGRSFYVSLISELAGDMICSELGLPASSIVLNAAGRFTILAPNTESSKSGIKRVEETLNKWLIENFYGETTIVIAFIEASLGNLVGGNFHHLWERLQAEADKKKYSKLDIERYGGPITTYIDSFDNSLGRPLCPFCGKRPSHHSAFIDLAEGRKECACKPCHDHIYIGEHLVKEERFAITTCEADLRGDKLLEPIFSLYQVSFDVSGDLSSLSKSGTLLKYWDIRIPKDGIGGKDITAKFINGFVPVCTEEDRHDDRLLYGRKSETTKLELLESLRPGVPKTFLHIAKQALNPTETPGVFTGVEALGVLKADVDNLGLIFSYGIKPERQTLSRIATLSRQLNNYFAVYIPHRLATEKAFSNTYTVFAGGDDLFLIGPWNQMIKAAALVKNTFSEYVCGQGSITICAGISVNKPGEDIRALSEMAEEALDKSKQAAGKDSVSIFDETVKWHAFAKLDQIASRFEGWLQDGTINSAMLFRVNEISEMAKQEKELRASKKAIHLEDMECLKWRARLKYAIVRNVGRSLEGNDKNSIIDQVLEVAGWLEEYAGGLKIPLWYVIYNRR